MHARSIHLGIVLALTSAAAIAAPRPIPDLTAGGKPTKSHDWNLGPTGARGWVADDGRHTTPSRQILITTVDKSSPADGVLAVGDVIVGVNGKRFASDARVALAEAITRAEQSAGRGQLRLMRWRDGRVDAATLTLRVMGSYSATAPYDCAKSKRILEEGCRHILAKKDYYSYERVINLLVLMAASDAHIPHVKQAVYGWPAEAPVTWYLPTWGIGQVNLVMAEYFLLTGDREILPRIRSYSEALADGQSPEGQWGHGLANGKPLGGYGSVNQTGLVCHLSLVLAKKCGIESAKVDAAIERANASLWRYVDRGAVPYGTRGGVTRTLHDDNGKCSLAAIIFGVQGDRAAHAYYARMAIAGHDEFEFGHTGNYYGIVWCSVGPAQAGERAHAAYFKKLSWYYDLARRADGGFKFQDCVGPTKAHYRKFEGTSAHLLAYAAPLRRLYITGKRDDGANLEQLAGFELLGVLDAGEAFTYQDFGSGRYKAMPTPKLLTYLSSWSPTVRFRAAAAVAARIDPALERKVLGYIASTSTPRRYGAMEVIVHLKKRGRFAEPALTPLKDSPDPLLKEHAERALRAIGHKIPLTRYEPASR